METYKICIKCKENKNSDNFLFLKKKGYHITRCKECVNEREREKYKIKNGKECSKTKSKKRRTKFFAYLAEVKSVPCMDCGKTYPAPCMDFDHRDRSTKISNVGHLSNVGPIRLNAEIAKCDIICANCHRIRTQAEIKDLPKPKVKIVERKTESDYVDVPIAVGEQTKICTGCKIEKSLVNFHRWNHSSSGYRPRCKCCRAEEAITYRNNNRELIRKKGIAKAKEIADWLSDYKNNRPCEECGERFPYFILEYDHIDETNKRAPVSKLRGWTCSKEILLAEIAKCRLLCCNCHRSITWKRLKAKRET